MQNGTVQRWFAERGYGFVQADDGQCYFVHHNEIRGQGNLHEGDRVTFEYRASGRELPIAFDVAIVVPAEQ